MSVAKSGIFLFIGGLFRRFESVFWCFSRKALLLQQIGPSRLILVDNSFPDLRLFNFFTNPL